MQRIRNIPKTMSHNKSYGISCDTISNKVDETCKQNEAKPMTFRLGYRHLVAFYSFLYFGFVNCHVSTLTLSMVATVNRTQISSGTKNATVLSCPIPEVSDYVSKNPQIEGSFTWDAQTQGMILGLSTTGYVVANFFSGRIGQKFGAKRTLLVADVFLNICTLTSPIAAFWSAYALMAVQIVRGFFQGFILPCVFIMMANWFPRRERGLLSSFATCGTSFLSCISVLVIGKLCDVPSMRWPSAFYVIGAFNLIVTLSYAFFYYEVPKSHPRISKAELDYITGDQESDMSLKRPPAPWKAIFTSIPVYALTFGKFGFNWSIAHFVYMHPTFMGTVLHFSMTENGNFVSVLYFIMAISTIISMTASFWLRQKSILSVNSLRKGCSFLSAFGCALCLVGVRFAGCDAKLSMIFCGLAIFFGGTGNCGTLIVTGDMSPKFSGLLAGITSSISCLAYTIVPLIVRTITKHESLEEWKMVFNVHIAVIASCGILFQVFGSAELQPFDSVTAPEETTLVQSDSKSSTKNHIQLTDTVLITS